MGIRGTSQELKLKLAWARGGDRSYGWSLRASGIANVCLGPGAESLGCTRMALASWLELLIDLLPLHSRWWENTTDVLSGVSNLRESSHLPTANW